MLAELQRQFIKALNDNENQTKFSQTIQPNPKLPIKAIMAIYHGSITECLANALRETYPVCQKLVGNDFFTAMAYRFTEKNPSTSENLFHYGEPFPKFIRNFEPAKSLFYLGDVATLEWAWHIAYYQGISSRLDFNYPIYRIWQVNQENYTGDQKVHLNHKPESLLVKRENQQVEIIVK